LSGDLPERSSTISKAAQTGEFSGDRARLGAWRAPRVGAISVALKPEEQLSELEKLASELDVDVTYEPMGGLVQGVGGLCRLRGRYRIIVDRKLKPPERLQVVADALRRFDTDEHFVSPQVRRLLD
jgi:hypothetical protein